MSPNERVVPITAVIACGLWLAACGGEKQPIISDPVGSSTFFVQNRLGVPIEVEAVYANNAGGGQLSAVVLAGQRLDLGTKAAFAPPAPSQVFVSIQARRGDWLASRTVIVYEPASAAEDDAIWQKTVRKADYPPEYEYTLALDEAAFNR